jgi:hypothetical protein
LYTKCAAASGEEEGRMYLVTWIEGEEVEYRLLPSEEELPEELEEEKNSIVVEIENALKN